MRSFEVLALCVLALAASAVIAATASATSVLYLTDAQQATLSSAVVVAQVGHSVTDEDPALGHILTHTTLRVEEILFGDAPPELVVHQSGGTVGNRTLHVPGAARLEQGERCVLFLRHVDGRWFLTALEQSKYTIEASIFGERLRRPKLGGLFTADATGSLVPTEEPVRPVLTLVALRSILKQAATAPAPEAK